MKKRMTIMIILLMIVFGGIFGWDMLRIYFMHKYFANFQPPPVTISATKAQQITWQPSLKAIGTLVAVKGVNISPEVSGTITKIYFQSGQLIQANQPILTIDDRVEKAELASARAQLQLDQLNFKRMAELYKTHTSSKAQVDNAEAQLKQSQADVNKYTALIEEKNIDAPFAGRLGIREVNVGQYISPGKTIVNLQTISPIYVNFYLPEQDLPRLYQQQPVQITVDPYPGEKFPGIINAINATVDVKTHNILVQAIFPNQDKKLYPGLFANIRVELPEKSNVIVVPTTAVTFSLFGDSVYVIHNTGTDAKGQPILRVQQRYVKAGDTINDNTIILQGIKAGEEVVTSGQLKLDNNTQVLINNNVKLTDNYNEIY